MSIGANYVSIKSKLLLFVRVIANYYQSKEKVSCVELAIRGIELDGAEQRTSTNSGNENGESKGTLPVIQSERRR